MRHNKALSNELIWTKEKVYMRGYPEEWFAVARTASKPDALQGFHADDVLYIIDEASGIVAPILNLLSLYKRYPTAKSSPNRGAGAERLSSYFLRQTMHSQIGRASCRERV